MSKEIDHIKLEAPIEKAMDAMEPSTDITDEQLQEMLLDKESRQAAQDILESIRNLLVTKLQIIMYSTDLEETQW